MLSPKRCGPLFFIFLCFFLLSMISICFYWAPVQVAEKVKPVDLSTAIIQAAKQTLPAVVYIEVTESQEVSNPFSHFENDPFFRRFFGVPKMLKKLKQEMRAYSGNRNLAY